MIQGIDIDATQEGTHGAALLHQRLLPADSKCSARPLLPRAGAIRRSGFLGDEGDSTKRVVRRVF